ncbi:MAG TPA: DUF4384 domain-containing protein [Gemmatimonadaceae bacterium]|nr:DUF4384 domain-containing protein [Gemmatimonadaceae bacterium]
MFSVALLSLLLPLANPTPVAASPLAGATRASAADPSIRVSLNRTDFEPGDQARVTVSVRDDGYLLVLRLSPDGYVRVLFPLDPGDDNFVRGNGSYEIRGRGDREAFTVSSSSGTGTVYAAWSTEPFRFDDYVLGDHWDYRALDGSQMQGDAEAALTELVQRMSTGHFDYDLVSYSVARQVAYSSTTHYVTLYPAPYPYPYAYPADCYYYGWCGSGFSVSFGFGWGNPYFYDPFFRHRPFYRYYPRHYGCFGCGYRYPSVIVINRPSYRGYYPYQWKPGNRGGGGAPGVQYRPRGVAYASAVGQPVSPLYQASKYRRVAGNAPETRAGRRQPAATVFGAPMRSGSGTSVGTARRAPGREVEVIRGGVRGGPTPPRRAGESDGVIDLRGGNGSRVTPRTVDGAGSGNSSSQRRGIAEPRRSEPQGTARSTPESGARPEPRRVEPRSVEPRAVEPRSVQPRSVEPRSSQPRSVEPRSTEPRTEAPQQSPRREVPTAVRAEPRAELRRVEPRTVDRSSAYEARPQRVERTAPVQRAEPRSMPRASEPRSMPRASEPRSAPAPRASQPRSSQPRSAPAPRGRRP